VKSALSGTLRGLIDKTVDANTANAVAKVAAQLNNIMRTELDAAKLHYEITGKKHEYALTAIGYVAEEAE
jgi:predicted oxidoreductase